MKWLNRFWDDHGDRLVFMAITTVFGVGFYMLDDMQGEAKVLLIAVATLALNKARSKQNEVESKSPTPPNPII